MNEQYKLGGLTAALSNAALTGLSGAATTHSYSAFLISYRGILTTIAANSGVATPTTDAVTGAAFLPLTASKGCVFLWQVTPAEVDNVTQGKIVDLDAQGNFTWTLPSWPPIADGTVAYAYAVIKASAAASTWTFGSSNWNATGISIVVKNISTLPSRIVLS